MSNKIQIIIVDSSKNRRDSLVDLWHGKLDCKVFYSDGYDCYDADQPVEKQVNWEDVKATACLFHSSDDERYESNQLLKNAVDACQFKYLFSTGGVKDNRHFASDFHPLSCPISNPAEIHDAYWIQFKETLTETTQTENSPSTLETGQEPHYLRALYILCEGCLASLRMTSGIPKSAKNTVMQQQWWKMPLLAAAPQPLEELIKDEWITEVPCPVKSLCDWIVGESEVKSEEEFEDIVLQARNSLYNRLK